MKTSLRMRMRFPFCDYGRILAKLRRPAKRNSPMKNLLRLLAAFCCCAAVAHPLDIAYLQLRVESGSLRATLDVHPNVAQLVKSVSESKLASDKGDCGWENQRTETFPQTVRLTADAHCPQ